jgi:hypothetical protein
MSRPTPDDRSAPPTPLPLRRPWWFGALLAPLVAPFALVLLLAATEGMSGRALRFEAMVEVLVFAIALGLPLAYLGFALCGLPLIWWLRRRGKLSALALCVAAAPLGAAMLVSGMALVGAKIALPVQLGLGAVLALAVALAFCVICGVGWRADPRR